MYQEWILNLSCLFLLMGLSVESTVTTSRCFQYKECWTCVGDPCSRRKEAEDVNNICVWCENYPDVGPACISTRQDRMCFPEVIKYADQCKTEAEKTTLTDSRLSPFITKNYTVHLEYLRNDVFGTIQKVVGVQNFKVWIALNRVVNTKSVVDKCGRHTPISSIEMDDIMTNSYPIGRRDRCWNLGQVKSARPIPLDIFKPEEGIVLDFGTSPCCSCSSNTKYINTTVLLKEGYCLHDFFNSSVTEGNTAMLTNCSESNSSLQFVVQTSVLCRNHLEWRLSVKNTTAFCTVIESKKFRCKIDLKSAIPTVVIASSSPYCQNNFLLWKRFSNGSKVNVSLNQLLLKNNIQEDSCHFVIDLQVLCKLSLVYVYANDTPQLIPINGSASLQSNVCDVAKPSHSRWWLAVGGAIVCLVIITICVLVCKRQRHSRDDYKSLRNSNPNRSEIPIESVNENCQSLSLNAQININSASATDQRMGDTGSMAEAHTEIADIQSASDKDTRRVQNGINRVEARIKQLETTVNRIETMLDKYIQAVDRSDNRT